MKKAWLHFKKICLHKYWVGKYCFQVGLYWRGIKHDLSKLSFTEFIESIQYYNGKQSPIEKAKEKQGYSKAWLHHKGQNDHHWEYWMDGGKCLEMPFEAAAEMLCDYLGAGRAYMEKKFSYAKEYEWWQNYKAKELIHKNTAAFIEKCLKDLYICEKHDCRDYDWFNKDYLIVTYCQTGGKINE